ncbi:hypothetical protein [uncultured Shimia sp.]|uniref:hypothetical protein n=1 Tax=uncultured Shimia sp. TaxID=573152 RepID=UPI0025E8A26F|nr:hypothetical protein [uncultured Shimia sp.]
MTQRRDMLSATLLLMVSGFAIGAEFHSLQPAAPLAGAALLTVTVLQWRPMAGIARATVLAALLLGAYYYLRGTLTTDILHRAIQRSAFFTLFVIALDILRTAAMGSAMVLDSGKTIVSQPPGRRYAMISLGAHIFALLLSVGTINLLGTMNQRSIDASPTNDPAHIREIRLRRMTMALIRGFAAVTLWAPTTVTVVVVVSAVPNLDWYQFFPLGISTAAGFLLFGWILDRVSYRQPPRAPATAPLGSILLSLIPLISLTFGVLLITIALAAATGIRPIAALLICVPLFGLCWIALQNRRAGPMGALILTKRRLHRQVLPDIVTARSEIAILASAGFIAVVLPTQIDTQALGLFIAGLGITEPWLLVLTMWLITFTAPIGLNPIITVSVSIEILARLSGFAFTPYALAFAGTAAWALSTGISPFGATIRLTARCINRPVLDVGMKWNLPFTLYVLTASSVLVFILN